MAALLCNAGLGIAIDKEKTLDSLEQILRSGLSKDALIKLARKWNEHGYPNNEKEGLKNLVREECAREMIAAAIDRASAAAPLVQTNDMNLSGAVR